jgi:DNA polymerase-3 subunit beta
MNIILEKIILEKILINTQPFIEKKDLSQITSHIYIQAKDNQVFIKATDFEIGIQLNTTKVTISEEGEATANGKKILDIIKHLQSKDILLYTKSSFLIIEQDNAQFKVPMFTPSEFPNFPKVIQKNKININQTNFIKGLRQAMPSVDTNNPKYELNGTLINFTENHYDIVSTDTKRLSIINFKESIGKNESIIIPKKSSIELQKIIHQDSKLFFDKTNLIIQNDNIFFFTKLINGEYPKYERIIPTNIKHTITLPKKDILDALQMIASLSTIVIIKFQQNTIKFTTSIEAQSQAKVDIDIKTNLDAFNLNVNIRYITDFLHTIEEDTFEIQLNEENLPFIISSNNYKKIIMPVIL